MQMATANANAAKAAVRGLGVLIISGLPHSQSDPVLEYRDRAAG